VGIAQIRNYTRWQRTIGLNYEVENYRADEEDKSRRSHLFLPNIRWSLLNAKDAINTYRGSRFTINLRGAAKSALSSVSFAQALMQYKWIYTIASDNRLILRTDLGYTAVKDLEKLPVSKRFYTGGIDGVRGYGYKSIGPGRYLAIASGEFQRRIVGNWYAAAFYDVGSASEHIHTKFSRGAGLGIVWKSPMGALRFYLAQALSKKHKPIQVAFSFGPDL
jgi:translocation and assembly module TamA